MKSDEQLRPIIHGPLRMRVGTCSESCAFVYTPIPADIQSRVCEIAGRVRGPFSPYATTLPTTHNLKLMELPDQTIMGTYITDPCLWSPEQPMLYAAELNVVNPSGEEIQYWGNLTFRSFVTRGKSLHLNGKRWVLRAAHDHDSAPSEDVSEWRQHFTGRVSVWRCDRPLFSDASRLGVAVVAEQISRRGDVHTMLSEMSRQASIMIVLLLPDQAPPPDARKEFPPLLLAQRVQSADSLAAWADVAWVAVDTVDDFAKGIAGINIPIIAVRRHRGTSLAAARAAIDTLQADLAPIGQFAGYVV